MLSIKERAVKRLQFLSTRWSHLAALNPEHSREFVQGGRDYEQGVAVTDCPCLNDLRALLEWHAGWMSAKRAYDQIADFEENCKARGVMRCGKELR